MRFLGRDDELRTITDVVGSAAAGAPVGVLVDGEAGIGKSRLLAEVARELTGVTTAWGGCAADASRLAFRPWLELLSGLTLLVPPARLDPPLVGETHLQSLLGTDAIAAGSHETSRHVLSAAVAEYLTRCTRETGTPLVLLLDDLHGADLPSLRLLTFLVERPLEGPIAIVATRRTDAAPEAAGPLLDAVGRHLEPLSLAGLASGITGELLADAGIAVSPSDADALWQLTHGNPLLIQEAIRHVAAGVPAPAHSDVLDARLGVVSADAFALLRTAAVLGEQFDLALVAAAEGVAVPAAAALLQEATRSGLVDPARDGIARYRFVHGTYRERLLERLDDLDRADRHHRILRAVEALRGDDPRFLSVRAHHAVAAVPVGDPAEAVVLCRRAGDQALGRLAPEVAVEHYRDALALIEAFGDDHDDELDIRLTAGIALASAADPGAEQALGDVMRLAEARGAPDALATAVLFLPTNTGIVGQAPWGDVHAEKALRHALGILPPDPSPLRVRVLCELAHITYNQPDGGDVGALCDEAVDLARRLDDPECSAWADVTDHLVRPHKGDRTTRVEAADVVATGVGHTDVDLRLAAEGLAVTTLMADGRFTHVEDRVHALEAALPSLPPLARWSTLRWTTACALARGRFDDGEQLMAATLKAAAGTRHEGIATLSFGIQAFTLARERGQLAELVPLVRQWVDDHPGFLGFRATLAFLLVDLGDLDAARDELDAVFETDIGGLAPYTTDYVPLLALSGHVAGRLAHADRAASCLDLLAPHLHEFLVVGAGTAVPGPVAMFASTAAVAVGRLDDAVELGTRAVRMARRAGALPALHHSQVELARALHARGTADDIEAASRFAGDAVAGYRQLGMASFGGPAAALRDRPPETSRRAPAHLEGEWRRTGSRWEVSLGSETALVSDVKGLAMVGVLLQRPDVEVHALELSAAVDGMDPTRPSAPAGGPTASDPVLDSAALAAYRERIGELESILDESDRNADIERAARAKLELDFIVAELGRATGLRGRSRSQDRTAERARVRVTKAIKSAIAKISDDAPGLAFHLDASIRTGVFCRYAPPPDRRPTWHF